MKLTLSPLTAIRRVFWRIDALLKRYRKRRDWWGWIRRWDLACMKSWAILSNGNPTIQRFERWQRNHQRLMNLIDKKNRLL